MSYITIVGICASVFTSFALVPQLITLIKKKTAKDVSVTMIVVLLIGLLLWIYYGALRSDPIIILSNAFACVVNIATGVLTIHYGPGKVPPRASNRWRQAEDR